MVARSLPEFARSSVGELVRRLSEPRRVMHVVAGPRQVGKTTMVLQALDRSGLRHRFVSGDEAPAAGPGPWLESVWDGAERAGIDLLVVDEVQRIAGWSRVIKARWDRGSREGSRMLVVVLGSAPLAVEQGLNDDLAGRFELLRLPHWSLGEMREAFGWDLETFLRFGGYPGSVRLISEPLRWATFVRDALIEPTLQRDVFELRRVDKPALLRGVFEVACTYPAQVVSFNSMLGTLQDAGNTATLADHLRLLEGAGLVVGLSKFAGTMIRGRASSPKLVPLAPAMLTVTTGEGLDGPLTPDRRGRVLETAICARTATWARERGAKVSWWRESGREVDLVVEHAGTINAIEVKSSRMRRSFLGLKAFAASHPSARPIVLGPDEHEAFLDDPGSILGS